MKLKILYRLEASTNIKHVAQGWQSEGNTGTPWLGPDVQDLTRNYTMNIIIKLYLYTSWICL